MNRSSSVAIRRKSALRGEGRRERSGVAGNLFRSATRSPARILFTFALAALLGTVGSLAEAQTPAKSFRQRFLDVEADAAQRERVVAAGRQASAMCTGCHGADGNSSMPDAPNLAGQNPVYLMIQFHKLDNGLRMHETMQSIVKTLSADDRFNIAFYYSVQPVRPPSPRMRTASLAGEQIYATQFCVYCHGDSAKGTDRIPRLAGQQRAYLVRAMTQYRNRSGERRDAMMSAVLDSLSDQNIASLADYLSGLGDTN